MNFQEWNGHLLNRRFYYTDLALSNNTTTNTIVILDFRRQIYIFEEEIKFLGKAEYSIVAPFSHLKIHPV